VVLFIGQQQSLYWFGHHFPGPHLPDSGAGLAACLDLKTGQTIWEERLTETAARNGSYSSPVLVQGRLYVVNQNADTFVIPEPKIRMPGHKLYWKRTDERVVGGVGRGHFHPD